MWFVQTGALVLTRIDNWLAAGLCPVRRSSSDCQHATGASEGKLHVYTVCRQVHVPWPYCRAAQGHRNHDRRRGAGGAFSEDPGLHTGIRVEATAELTPSTQHWGAAWTRNMPTAQPKLQLLLFIIIKGTIANKTNVIHIAMVLPTLQPTCMSHQVWRHRCSIAPST